MAPDELVLHVDAHAMRSRLLTELPARVAAARGRRIEFGAQGATQSIPCSADAAASEPLRKSLAALPTPALAALYLTADPKARGAQSWSAPYYAALGHALADAANAAALADLSAARTSLRAELAPLLRREDEQGPEALVSDAEVRALVDGVQHVEAAAERVYRMGEPGPVLRRYRRARSLRKGPTPYGARSLAATHRRAPLA